MKKREFNIMGLVVVSTLFLLGTFTLFPDTLASAEDETQNQDFDATILNADVVESQSGEGENTQDNTIESSVDQTSSEEGINIETEIETDSSILEEFKKEINNAIVNPEEVSQPVLSGNNVTGDNLTGNSITGSILLETDLNEDLETEITEEVIEVPPVSNEKQDVVIYDQEDYVDLFNSEDMLFHEMPKLTQEDLFELEPEDVIDHYVVDDGRIAVTTTVEGVFLRVKLSQPATQ